MNSTLRFIFGGVLAIALFLSACDKQQDQENSANTKEEQLAPKAILANIKADLASLKATLANEGEYNCCIQPTCNWCALNEGDCECYDNLKDGRKVCPGCGLGWHNGKGVAEGFQANEIKWDIAHEHHEHEGEHAH